MKKEEGLENLAALQDVRKSLEVAIVKMYWGKDREDGWYQQLILMLSEVQSIIDEYI